MLTSKLLKNRKNAKFDKLQLYLSLKNREIKYSRNMAHDFSQDLIHAKLSENKVAQGRLFTIFPDFISIFQTFSRIQDSEQTLGSWNLLLPKRLLDLQKKNMHSCWPQYGEHHMWTTPNAEVSPSFPNTDKSQMRWTTQCYKCYSFILEVDFTTKKAYWPHWVALSQHSLT